MTFNIKVSHCFSSHPLLAAQVLELRTIQCCSVSEERTASITALALQLLKLYSQCRKAIDSDSLSLKKKTKILLFLLFGPDFLEDTLLFLNRRADNEKTAETVMGAAKLS